MRVYSPGSAVAELISTSFSDEHVEFFRANVQAGNFAEIELLVQEGFQLVTLESTEPVIAAIKNSSIEPVLDFGWVQPAQRFTSVSIPLTTYQNTLVIANPQSLPLEVTVEILSSGRSSVQNIVIAPFDSLPIPVRRTSVRLESDLEFAVSLELLDDLGYSLVHPTESRNLGLDLSIQVR
jgi:hypothetical protein